MNDNFSTWVKTTAGCISEQGLAVDFDAAVEMVYELLRQYCEEEQWVPTNVTQCFSTASHGTDVLCVMTITAQLVKQEFLARQQFQQNLNPHTPNGLRR